MKILVVVDMQNDFIDGSLGAEQARLIVPKVVEKIKNHNGIVFYTKDTHDNNYLETLEGVNLPIKHCIKETNGHDLDCNVESAKEIYPTRVVEKNTFGSFTLANKIDEIIARDRKNIESIELVGLCTGICVISNALILRAKFPNIKIFVDSDCCACVTKESHENALKAMQMCQIEVI